MTAKEKGDCIIYINYLVGLGEQSRRKSRDPDLNTYMQGWLAGSGEIRKQIAGELELWLDSCETEI